MGTTTHMVKGRDGWRAKNLIEMGVAVGSMGRPGTRVLEVETSKHRRGGLVTRAYCTVNDSTGCTTFLIFGDYSVTVMQSPGKATEKSIRTQQDTVMREYIGGVLDQARAFYAGKEEARALHERRDAELAAQEAACETKSALDYPEIHAAGCSG